MKYGGQLLHCCRSLEYYCTSSKQILFAIICTSHLLVVLRTPRTIWCIIDYDILCVCPLIFHRTEYASHQSGELTFISIHGFMQYTSGDYGHRTSNSVITIRGVQPYNVQYNRTTWWGGQLPNNDQTNKFQ